MRELIHEADSEIVEEWKWVSSLDGNVRLAIDLHEGDKLDEAALKDLIRAAVALNLEDNGKPKPRRASSKRRSLRG